MRGGGGGGGGGGGDMPRTNRSSTCMTLQNNDHNYRTKNS